MSVRMTINLGRASEAFLDKEVKYEYGQPHSPRRNTPTITRYGKTFYKQGDFIREAGDNYSVQYRGGSTVDGFSTKAAARKYARANRTGFDYSIVRSAWWLDVGY